MPKIQFIENDNISPPYISADVQFGFYGETKVVSEQIANYLLSTHGDKFKAVDGYSVPSSAPGATREMVKVRFVHNDYLTEYHSLNVSFTRFGQVKEVSVSEAEYLLDVHADKFQLAETVVVETPKEEPVVDIAVTVEPEIMVEDAVISEEVVEPEAVVEEAEDPKKKEDEALRQSIIEFLRNKDEQRIGEIASSIGDMHYRTLQPIINVLVTEGLLEVTEKIADGRAYASRYYKLK